MNCSKYHERHLSPERIGAFARDCLLMSKPRIVTLAAGTVAIGFIAGTEEGFPFFRASLCVGIMSCLAAACGVLNQAIEARFDSEMRRTTDRPICDGRVTLERAQQIGILLSVVSIFGAIAAFGWLTAVASIAVLLLYIAIYTPLKRRTFLGTVGGAASGCLPPLLGWLATGRSVEDSIGWLVAFLFVWQFPHFLAISAVYEKDYEAAGFRMIPVTRTGQSTLGLVSTLYASVGIPLFWMLSGTGLMSSTAGAGGFWLSLIYLWLSVTLWRFDDAKSARRLMVYSLFFVMYVFVAIGHKRIVGA